MDKAVKIAIVLGILLASFGVFYHYVVYLPDLEQRKAEKERAENEAAARRAEIERIETARRAALERRAALLAEEQRMQPAKRKATHRASTVSPPCRQETTPSRPSSRASRR